MSEARPRTDGRSWGSPRLALISLAIAVALAIAGLALMNVGAGVMETRAERTAITEAQYRDARIGEATRRQLERRFGSSMRMPSSVSRECDYYLQRNRHGVLFRLCFDAGGTLVSKGRAAN
jgi:hypothetical protein